MTAARAALAVSLLLLELGCKPPGQETAAAKAPPPPPARAAVEVLLPDGNVTARLEPEADGYLLHDVAGWPIGRARVAADRVTMEDRSGQPLCTAKTTPNGFVLDDGSKTPRLVGTEDGAGVRVTRAGAEVARLSAGALRAGGHTLRAEPAAERLNVTLDGEAVLALRGFSHESGAWLAWTELTFPERITMMLFHAERL